VKIRIAIALIVVAVIAGVWLVRGRMPRAGVVQAPGLATPSPVTETRKEEVAPQSLCPREAGAVTRQYGSFKVRVERDADDMCHYEIRLANGQHWGEDDIPLALGARHVDLDRDDVPELIIVADSGGSSLHADTYVFTEKPQPHLVEKYDGCATEIFDAGNGGRVLRTCHLGFNMMDGICNGCSPRPRIFYALENGVLKNSNARFAAEYDKSIAFEEQELKTLDVAEFVASTKDDDPAYSNSEVRWRVMSILANYIYSDRDAKAIEVAGKLWPAWDRDRILNDLGAHPSSRQP